MSDENLTEEEIRNKESFERDLAELEQETPKTKKEAKKKKETQSAENEVGKNPTGRHEKQKIRFGKLVAQPLEDQLFDVEKKALEELKKKPIAKHYQDRFLMATLFSRKLDVERAEELLNNNKKFLSENGYESLPKYSDISKKILDTRYSWWIPGSRSKEGNGLIYAKFARLVPSEHTHKEIIDWMVWIHSSAMYYEGMDFFRNGAIFIEDLSGVGWKHFDSGLQKKIMKTMQNFPLRMKAIYIVNPPLIISALLRFAKVFMKKKLVDRIDVISSDKLKEIIDINELSIEFGGKFEGSSDLFLDALAKIGRLENGEDVNVVLENGEKKKRKDKKDKKDKKDRKDRKERKEKREKKENS